ncbi:MAG TPA: hypothetical protein VEQ40_08340, partial [Pyrinomonadaceae bacterium]|nr:hypothetical protein [Pyrinomonadaceae bacterium]
LYEQLGIRAKAIQQNLDLSSSFEPSAVHNISTMGILDDVRDYGKRLFRRWSAEGYKLICGDDPEDEEDRKELVEAFGLDNNKVASMMAGMLVAQLGLAPAIAAVIAAILIKRFLLNPAYEQFCALWKDYLPQT